MIENFANLEVERLYQTGKSRRLPPDILRRALRLAQLHAAVDVEDLRLPPFNHLESLRGDRAGQCSIRINQQRRGCFRFGDSNAYDVDIVDYH